MPKPNLKKLESEVASILRSAEDTIASWQNQPSSQLMKMVRNQMTEAKKKIIEAIRKSVRESSFRLNLFQSFERLQRFASHRPS